MLLPMAHRHINSALFLQMINWKQFPDLKTVYHD